MKVIRSKTKGSAKEKIGSDLEVEISRIIYRNPGTPQSHPLQYNRVLEYKMVKIIVGNFSDEDIRKKYMELYRKESWDSECEMCKMPEILHKGECSRKTEVITIDHQ